MANNKNLKSYKKGQSGNLAGRPPDPPELKAIQRLTKAELELLLTNILRAKPDELKQYNNSVLELWLASGATKAIQSGDYSRLSVLLERIIGKVSDKMEIDVKPIEQWTKEEKVKLLQESEANIQKLKEEIESE